MNFLRQLGYGLSTMLFSLAIFLFAAFISIYYVFDTPKPLKSALDQSGVYGIAVQNTLEQNQGQDQSSDSIPLNNAGVSAAIQKALPPEKVQANAEKAIDSIYDWVHGKTKAPDFSINLGQEKTDAANNISAYLRGKLSALPVCAGGAPVPQNTDDLFSATCRPANASVDTLTAQVQKQAESDGITKDTTFSASDLKDKNGQPLFDRLSAVPRGYHYFKLSLFVLPAVILLSATGVVLLNRSRRAGVRTLSSTLLTTGIYSIAIALLAIWGINHFANSLPAHSTADQAALAEKIINVIRTLVSDLRVWWLGFGIGYIVLAIGGFVTLHFIKPKGEKPSNPRTEHETPAHPLGHNTDIPSAGTTFTADSHMPASAPSIEPPHSATPEHSPDSNKKSS